MQSDPYYILVQLDYLKTQISYTEADVQNYQQVLETRYGIKFPPGTKQYVEYHYAKHLYTKHHVSLYTEDYSTMYVTGAAYVLAYSNNSDALSMLTTPYTTHPDITWYPQYELAEILDPQVRTLVETTAEKTWSSTTQSNVGDYKYMRVYVLEKSDTINPNDKMLSLLLEESINNGIKRTTEELL